MNTMVSASRTGHAWALTPEGIIEVDTDDGAVTLTAAQVSESTRLVNRLAGQVVTRFGQIHMRSCPRISGFDTAALVSTEDVAHAAFFVLMAFHDCVWEQK